MSSRGSFEGSAGISDNSFGDDFLSEDSIFCSGGCSRPEDIVSCCSRGNHGIPSDVASSCCSRDSPTDSVVVCCTGISFRFKTVCVAYFFWLDW